MGDFGLGALALGSGAQAGLQQLLKQRLLERQMALQEQAQRESMEFRNRELSQRATEADETRKLNEFYRQDASNQRWAGIEQKAGDNLVQSKPVGGTIDDAEEGLLQRTGNAGVIRAIPLTGTTIEGGQPAPIRFRGYTPQESGRIEDRTAMAAERSATRADAESLRREMQEDQQQFMAGQTASNQAFQRDMAAQKAATPQVKPPTGAARAAVKYFDRMKQAIENLKAVDEKIGQQGLLGQMQSEWAPNVMKTEAQQLYNQALNMFTEARLRKDSGAAVPPSEYAKDREVYGIQPGDSPGVIAQKVKSRADTARALAIEAGDAAMAEHYGEGWQSLLEGLGGSGGGSPAQPGGGVVEYVRGKDGKLVRKQ
jgi:hypothetical protein